MSDNQHYSSRVCINFDTIGGDANDKTYFRKLVDSLDKIEPNNNDIRIRANTSQNKWYMWIEGLHDAFDPYELCTKLKKVEFPLPTVTPQLDVKIIPSNMQDLKPTRIILEFDTTSTKPQLPQPPQYINSNVMNGNPSLFFLPNSVESNVESKSVMALTPASLAQMTQMPYLFPQFAQLQNTQPANIPTASNVKIEPVNRNSQRKKRDVKGKSAPKKKKKRRSRSPERKGFLEYITS